MALINVTLPDGTINEYASGITCAEVITDALGRKHGCLAAVVDGVERDMSCALDQDCSVEGIRSESEAGIHILRHSAAHLLAQAVMAIYPDAKPTIGPAIDRGFYYDFAMEAITESDLKALNSRMMNCKTILQTILTNWKSSTTKSKTVEAPPFTNKTTGMICALGPMFPTPPV